MLVKNDNESRIITLDDIYITSLKLRKGKDNETILLIKMKEPKSKKPVDSWVTHTGKLSLASLKYYINQMENPVLDAFNREFDTKDVVPQEVLEAKKELDACKSAESVL